MLKYYFDSQMASKTAEAGTITDPETLGACEPGTTINLDGIVWNETKGGKSAASIHLTLNYPSSQNIKGLTKI